MLPKVPMAVCMSPIYSREKFFRSAMIRDQDTGYRIQEHPIGLFTFSFSLFTYDKKQTLSPVTQVFHPILLFTPFFADFNVKVQEDFPAGEIFYGFTGFGAQFLDRLAAFADQHALL